MIEQTKKHIWIKKIKTFTNLDNGKENILYVGPAVMSKNNRTVIIKFPVDVIRIRKANSTNLLKDKYSVFSANERVIFSEEEIEKYFEYDEL